MAPFDIIVRLSRKLFTCELTSHCRESLAADVRQIAVLESDKFEDRLEAYSSWKPGLYLLPPSHTHLWLNIPRLVIDSLDSWSNSLSVRTIDGPMCVWLYTRISYVMVSYWQCYAYTDNARSLWVTRVPAHFTS